MIRILALPLLLCTLFSLAPRAAIAVTIDTVPVGDPGNPDLTAFSFIGAVGGVDYSYRIGTYEVTNAQYAEFLNAKAGADPFGLYDTKMSTTVYGGIMQSGASPNFTYSVKENFGNKPVNFVTYWDAERFANWMHNGQGSGDTETGSYTLGGVVTPPLSARLRDPGATWVLPTEDEWDKAAYYDPRSAADGGPPGSDQYWNFPTGSDTDPVAATANAIGDISNPGPNVASYLGQTNWNGSTGGNVTTVGSAGVASYYGTYDQGGNVAEWTYPSIGLQTLLMGGAAPLGNLGFVFLAATSRQSAIVAGIGAGVSDERFGFRLALVPEPSTLALSVVALAGLAVVGRRRRAAMIRILTLLSLLCATFCLTMRAARAVVFIDTVSIGDPGNGPDPAYLVELGPLGAVPYEYRMGTYEVTNEQYAEFLNAKAASDPFALYNTQMANQVYGGITRSGASPNFAYAVKPNMGNKPVNMVSYWDAARFANWLHNGQGDGDTETGSYALNGVLSPQTAATRVRTPGATWVIPTENEWDKAAYYDPRNAAQGGPPGDDHYWTYPTQSDVPPIFATATSTGEIANPGTNVANYAGQANWNGSTQGGMTTVGSAGPLSTSFYGTYDQAGNVGEWTLNSLPVGQAVLMGGSFFALSGEHFLTPLGRNIASVGGLSYSSSDLQLGFRLALVPEPSTLLLSVIALAGFAAAARRRSGDSRA